MKLSRIFEQVLNEDFKTQKRRFIGQGIDPEIVDSYINKFKHIKDKKFKEMFDTALDISVDPKNRNNIDAYTDFHELEQMVDYVSGLRPISSNMTVDKDENIEVSGEAIFKNDNVELFYADNPRACIKYKGKFPYSWCVARSDSSNMFYTYRFKPYEPAFYFVKDIQATEKEFGLWNMTKNVFEGKFKNKYHFFVIQVPKNIRIDDLDADQYIVTSANNDGDTQMSWNDILKISPKLAPLHKLLEPKPFTIEERAQHERFKNGIDDREFARLTYEEKRNYLDIYPTIARPISTRQLQALPDDLLNLYVSFGIGLNDEQFAFIKPKKDVLKRYAQISKRKFDEYMKRDKYDRQRLRMAYTELILLTDDDIGTYLKTLDKEDLNTFIHTYGEDKLDMLEKHLPDKFDAEHKTIKTILIAARDGDEGAIEQLQQMIPEGIVFNFHNNDIIFDTGNYGSYLRQHMDSDTLSYYNNFDDNAHGYGGYDDYFDGDDEGLENTYTRYIEEIIKDNSELGTSVRSVGFGWNVDSVKQLLEDKKEELETTIKEVYSEAKRDAEEHAWDKIKNKLKAIAYINYDEVEINLGSFIMFISEMGLKGKIPSEDGTILTDPKTGERYRKGITDNSFFTSDPEQFMDHLIYLLENIFEEYDVPSTYERAWEKVSEAGYNSNIDEAKIISEFEEAISEAVEFDDADTSDSDFDSDSDEHHVARLKSQIIKLLNDTLKGLGQDEHGSTLDNKLVHIDIDRRKFNMDGKVYIKMTDKTSGHKHEGYVFIKDLPSYFTNYKLFEQLQRIKSLIRY